MSDTIVVLDRSTVREGKLAELKRAMKELASFVDENEPRPFSYNVYFDHGETEMTVLQVHPDAASMEQHMRIAAREFPQFADLVDLRMMEVFGEPTESLLELLRRKAEMLGNATVVVHRRHAGFVRYG
jgi:quinol monooxygenase YgiN